MTDLTDEQIAQQVQTGDIQAFGILVERFEAKLSRYIKRFLFHHDDTADLLQTVFIKSYTNIQSFDTSRSFSSWIYRIAHNECINAIKKKGTEPLSFFDPDTLFPHPLAKSRPDHDLADEELKTMIATCLDKLDPKYREPLVLYYTEDLDYKTIAEIMHIPVSTIGVRINRAKTLLQKAYQAIHP
jgi:RNA polymerase sigma-70 factor (ECF subfamily)